MQIYMVGGAVRDALMGLPVKDQDWVVVGSTPEELLALGYLPVGRDFPVFLHPQTKDEYALARTERKTAPGYRGFAIHAAPDVTLEQDLARRDLTINSIATQAYSTRANGTFDTSKTTLIDPFGGQQDIAHKVLRHVTKAFREDPVRILRVARFAARFADFLVAPETCQLMREMVRDGEVDHLVSERVWQELARGLMEKRPSRFFEVLADCDALPRLFPEVRTLPEPLQTAALDVAATKQAPLSVRFACLCVSLLPSSQPVGQGADKTSGLEDISERLRATNECRELAEVVVREHEAIGKCGGFKAAALVDLLERCDAFRKPDRLADILLACECLAYAGQPATDKPYPQRKRLMRAQAAAKAVATDLIAAHAISTGAKGPKIGEMIHLARIAAVQRELGP